MIVKLEDKINVITPEMKDTLYNLGEVLNQHSNYVTNHWDEIRYEVGPSHKDYYDYASDMSGLFHDIMVILGLEFKSQYDPDDVVAQYKKELLDIF